jgi:hypothetical protein
MKKEDIIIKITNHTNQVQHVTLFERPVKKYEIVTPSSNKYIFDFSTQLIKKETEISYKDINGQLVVIELTLNQDQDTLIEFVYRLNLLNIGIFTIDGTNIIWDNCPKVF